MTTLSHMLAIYDENKMTRQLLHHEIEHQGFPVVFSCHEKNTLYSYLKMGKGLPSLLLLGAGYDWKKTLKVMKQVKFLCEKVEAIIYLQRESQIIASEFIKA